MGQRDRAPLGGATVGQRTAAAYLRAGLNPSQFARLLGIQGSTVWSWEREDERYKEPSDEDPRRVADLSALLASELRDRKFGLAEAKRQERALEVQQTVEDFLASQCGSLVGESEAEQLRGRQNLGERPARPDIIEAIWTSFHFGAGQ